MIVTDTARPAVHLGPGADRIRTRCLARRGMLHSECEAFDHIRLSPGAHYALSGREGTEAAWYVLRGPAVLTGRPTERTLTAGDLVLAPNGQDIRLRSGPDGAELLCLTVLPHRVSGQLPPRRPDLINHG